MNKLKLNNEHYTTHVPEPHKSDQHIVPKVKENLEYFTDIGWLGKHFIPLQNKIKNWELMYAPRINGERNSPQSIILF